MNTIAIPVVMILAQLLILRAMICNQKAHIQVTQILKTCVPGNADCSERLAALESVPYDKHMWALFFLRNPFRLYPEIIRRDFMKGE